MNLPATGALTEGVVRECLAPLFSYTVQGMSVCDDPDPSVANGDGFSGAYLANHSLGRPPDATLDNVVRAMRLWYGRLDECWEDDRWMSEVQTFRSQIALLLGLDVPDCVVPKTSAGQGLRAVLNAFPLDRPLRVVATTGEFDSIDFILKTYTQRGRAVVKWVPPGGRQGGVPVFGPADVCAAVTPDTDLVIVSSVFFGTGQILQGVEDIVACAKRHGARVLVDAYHAVGVVPFDMTEPEVDFVIGGSYKYLRGGPGACYLAIAPQVLDDDRLQTLDTGWFAKKDVFAYRRPDPPEYATGGDAWMESTPPVLTAFQANPGIRTTLSVGVGRARAYNLDQQDALRDRFRSHGVDCFQPPDPEAYGAFTLVPHPDASGLAARLKERAVTVDARGGFVRFGPDFLTTTDELEAAAQATAACWG
ncbi:MAG: aminotransferase class V-fold PLP-dependent enzyme [Armatimonadetes bacterium]|nr:aminotransferase class V-fold PLP-dependent enzyme [Armatimonadota bacterium]